MDMYRVQPGTDVDLSEWPTRDSAAFDGSKSDGKQAMKMLNEKIETLQELLYAEGKRRLLIVLQATDTGGKDGVIRHVFEGVNPSGVRVASFKAPSKLELSHDYLWRIHKQTPRKGEITIFNRSHYEDVLIVRVRNLVPESVWSQRYEHINAFEKMLADEGTTIVKFFLHLSKEEQAARFQARLDDPTKHWKFSLGDLRERERWDDYAKAYAAMLSKTSTPWAPWYVIPADRKWYRNLVIGTVVLETLQNFEMQYPPNEDDLSNVVIV